MACQSAFLLTASRSYAAHLCDTCLCPVQVNARIWADRQGHTPAYLLHGKQFYFDSSLASDLYFYKDRCFVEVRSRDNTHRISEITCVDTGNS